MEEEEEEGENVGGFLPLPRDARWGERPPVCCAPPPRHHCSQLGRVIP